MEKKYSNDKTLTLEQKERLKRMSWSVVVRYIVILAVVAVTMLGYLIGFNYYIEGILITVTIAFFYNLISSFIYHDINYPRWWPYFGIFFDMVVITLIVHFTGGIESIFLILYLLQIVGTNVHFSRLAGPFNFIFGGGLFVTLIILEQKGIIPHFSSAILPYGLYLKTNFIWVTSLVVIFFMGISAYRGGYVVHSLQIIEKKLFKVNKELIENNITISEANTRLKELDKMKTEFISVASHQMRTPLSAIKWTLKMILDGDMGHLNPEQKDLLSKSYQGNERMIILINDLLNVSRIEEGRFQYQMEKVPIEKVIEEVIEEMKPDIRERKIEFIFNKSKTPFPLVNIDPQKIHLAVQNLIDNSLKYTPSGGHVTVNLKQREREILFSVKDDGVGIPAKQQERIFSKFFRADNVIRMQTEGSGLGLFIVKNIVIAHKGKIWFESEEGRGSVFYFTLPCDEAKPPPSKKFEEFIQKI